MITVTCHMSFCGSREQSRHCLWPPILFLMFQHLLRVYQPVYFTHFHTIASSALFHLKQETSTVGHNAISFGTLASELAWNNKALVAILHKRLSGHVKDKLACCDPSTALDDLIFLATSVDLCFQEMSQEKKFACWNPRLVPTFNSTPVPGDQRNSRA